MNVRLPRFVNIILCIFLLGACGPRATATPDIITPTVVPPTNTPVSPTATTAHTKGIFPSLSITLGANNDSQGITLDQGGDVDTIVELRGEPAVETRRSGNNLTLPASDGNDIPDSYLQFNVDDAQFYQGEPTSHVRVEVDYFDTGSDSFSLQYDAVSGRFAGGGSVR